MSRLTRLLTLALLLLLLTPAPSHARAGGGHGYSGGGGGSHGGGGGGFGGGGGGFHYGGGSGVYRSSGRGGTASSSDLLFWGILIAIVIIAIAIHSRNQFDNTRQSSVIRKGNALEDAARDAEALAAIQRADPAFDKDQFLRRVRIAFDKIQSAWSAQDLTPVRPFISDGVHERFSLQFLEQKALGFRNQVQDIRILSLSLAQADTEGPFDTLSVRIAAQARDYDVSLDNGAKLPGTDRSEPFVEIWSFLRRRGAKTDPAKPGLIEGNCPNCGSAIDINQSAVCQYCKSLLRSGQYDWVLAEITQLSEWRSDRPSSLPGVESIRQRDPDFNVQELEDFASVCFWRKATADRTRDPQPLSKVSDPSFLAGYPLPHPAPDGSYAYVGQCAVGSVRTLGLLTDPDAHRALIEIRWSGTRYLSHPNARPIKTGPDVLTRSLLILSRSPSAVTQVDRALSSSHCPHCGAPLSLDTAATCEFCGTPLHDPRNGWVLSEFLSMISPQAQSLISRLQTATPNTQPLDATASDLLAWLVKTAMSDGVTTPAERTQLDIIAAKHNIPKQQLDRLLSAAAHNQLHPPEPRNPDQAKRWLESMVSMAIADGRLDPAEIALLRTAGAQLGLGDYDLDLLVKRQRQDLFTAARNRLRAT